MARIGVISDTHIPKKRKALPQALFDGLSGVDLIIHAGDINKDYVIYELEEIAPVEAVAGNTDDDYIHGMLGIKKLITVESCRIGIIHGDGAYGTTLERSRKAFLEDKPACVVFGHSHIPFNEVIDRVLFFNPGSPTDKRRQERFSYGILSVKDEKVVGEIRFF